MTYSPEESTTRSLIICNTQFLTTVDSNTSKKLKFLIWPHELFIYMTCLLLWIRAFHVNVMINLLRQSFNGINIYERCIESLWWNGDNQQNLKLSICTESADASTRVSEKAGRTTAPLSSPIFFYHFTPSPRPWSFPILTLAPEPRSSHSGDRSQRLAAARCLDSESKIPIQAGVSDERRHAALCLQRSRQLTEFSRLPRLPVTPRWQNPTQLPLRKGNVCSHPWTGGRRWR